MAWPKKHTRTIVVADREYLWHLSGNTIYSENRITVGTPDGKYVLFIDPYDHDFLIQPRPVREAIEWAIKHGWSPTDGPNRSMTGSDGDFRWLPEGVRFGLDEQMGTTTDP